MQPRLETLTEKKVVGLRIDMSFVDNRTRELWQTFMPRRKQIQNNLNADLYSIEIYPPHFFDHFDPTIVFQKWAAIEVADFDQVPMGMDTLQIPSGLYAVFIHKGLASDGPKTYEYIFNTWMPASNFETDERPHFALMGEKYRHEDPDSEEEIWIPVKPRI
jgi:AraC family transcriptional regulator